MSATAPPRTHSCPAAAIASPVGSGEAAVGVELGTAARARRRGRGARQVRALLLARVRPRVVGHRAAARRRLERHPADALEVQLGPRVQVVRVDLDALHALDPLIGGRALRVPDGDARGDADLAGEHRHRRGEVHAVAGLRLEELRDDVEAAAVVALLDGRLGRVVEVDAAQVRLDRDRRVVLRRRARRDGCRGVGDDRRELLGQREERAPCPRARRDPRRGAAAGSGSTSRRLTRYRWPPVFVSTLRTVSELSSQNHEPSSPSMLVVGYGTGSQVVRTSSTTTSIGCSDVCDPRGEPVGSRQRVDGVVAVDRPVGRAPHLALEPVEGEQREVRPIAVAREVVERRAWARACGGRGRGR